MRRFDKKRHIQRLNERLVRIKTDKVSELGVKYADLAEKHGIEHIGTSGVNNPLTLEFVVNNILDQNKFNAEQIECLRSGDMNIELEDSTCSPHFSIGGRKFTVGEIHNEEFLKAIGGGLMGESTELTESNVDTYQHALKQIGTDQINLVATGKEDSKEISGKVETIDYHSGSNGKPFMKITYDAPFTNDMTGEETPNRGELIVFYDGKGYTGKIAGKFYTIEPKDDVADKWLYYVNAENGKRLRGNEKEYLDRLRGTTTFKLSDGSEITGQVSYKMQGQTAVITVDVPNSNEMYYIYCEGDANDYRLTYKVAGKKEGENIIQPDSSNEHILKGLGEKHFGESVEQKKTIVEGMINMFDKLCGVKVIKEAVDTDTYFDTLSQALDAVRDKAEKAGYTVDEEEMWRRFGTGGVPYETTKDGTISLLKDGKPILNKRGKPLNRAIHVSIYRMPSGSYELTCYKTW
jgi:hypothetical protein